MNTLSANDASTKPAFRSSRLDRAAPYAKSPLRYPGGKSFATAKIRSYIPAGTDTLVSPFLGGGSLELACARDGVTVFGSDAFEPLVNFWQNALTDPRALAERVASYFPLPKSSFYALQQTFGRLQSSLERAAVFFVLNRCSFSGTTLSGGMSPDHPRFTRSAIDRLCRFAGNGLEVQCRDYKDALDLHPDAFAYLDPPYANGERLYGQRGDMHEFDHEEFREFISSRSGWILSYNDHPRIRALYERFDIVVPTWTYSMSNGSKSRELLILNI